MSLDGKSSGKTREGRGINHVMMVTTFRRLLTDFDRRQLIFLRFLIKINQGHEEKLASSSFGNSPPFLRANRFWESRAAAQGGPLATNRHLGYLGRCIISFHPLPGLMMILASGLNNHSD